MNFNYDLDDQKAELYAQSQIIQEYCHETDKGATWAKMLSYIHNKIAEKGFLGLLNSSNEVFAIKVLLGQRFNTSSYDSKTQKRFEELSSLIQKTDRDFTQLTGRENWMGSDLKNRLRFYEDEQFQEEVLYIYYSEIAPLVNLDFAIALSA
jgi:hypothetical protein